MTEVKVGFPLNKTIKEIGDSDQAFFSYPVLVLESKPQSDQLR